MSAWKVILATLVIFSAGLVAGGVAVRHLTKSETADLWKKNPFIPPTLRNEYLAVMNRELALTPEQYNAISNTVEQSQERVRILYDLIAPDLREELRFSREEIKAQLNPDQRKRFDDMPRKFPPRRPDRFEPHHPGGPNREGREMREPRDRDRDRDREGPRDNRSREDRSREPGGRRPPP